MTTIFESMDARARDCQQLVPDIDLIRPTTYEGSPTVETVLELLNGMAALYDLRFEALFAAYSQAIEEEKFFHYEIEECVMEWWRACEDLRCASEGVKKAILDNDGLDNVLLGVRSMALVRSARFFTLFPLAVAKAVRGAEPKPTGEPKAKAKAKKKAKPKALAKPKPV